MGEPSILSSYELLDDLALLDVKVEHLVRLLVVQQQHLRVLLLEEHLLRFEHAAVEALHNRKRQ